MAAFEPPLQMHVIDRLPKTVSRTIKRFGLRRGWKTAPRNRLADALLYGHYGRRGGARRPRT
jgi:hypothetical protein